MSFTNTVLTTVLQHGTGVMGGGWGLLWLLVLVGLVILVVSRLETGNSPGKGGPDSARTELRRRWASGEFSTEEFENRRQKLQRND